MTSKQLLLAGIAAGALAAAGSANALTISATTTNDAGPFTTTAPYTLAKELNFTSLSDAQGDFTLNTAFAGPNGAGLTTGTYTYVVTLNGANFNQSLSGGSQVGQAATSTTPFALTGNGATGSVTVTSGGASGSNTVTFSINVNGGQVTGLSLNPSIILTANTVAVSGSLTNAVSTVEPAFNGVLITNSQGFLVNGSPDTVPTGIAQDGGKFDVLATGTVNGQTYDTVIGSVTATAAATTTSFTGGNAVAHDDLKGDVVSVANDVTGVSVTVTGDFTKVDLTSTIAGSSLTATSTTSETINIPVTTGAAVPISLKQKGNASGAIAPSSYNATEVLTLRSPAFSGTETGNNPLQSLNIVGGFTYIIPWVNSAAQAASSGNTTVIRITNLSPTLSNTSPGATANVYGILVNNLATGTSVTGTAFLGTLGKRDTGNKEIIVTSTTLQNAFGDFSRGDLRLIIATTQNTGAAGTQTSTSGQAGTATQSTTGIQNGYVVKRLFSQANGGLTELSILSGDANTPATGNTIVAN